MPLRALEAPGQDLRGPKGATNSLNRRHVIAGPNSRRQGRARLPDDEVSPYGSNNRICMKLGPLRHGRASLRAAESQDVTRLLHPGGKARYQTAVKVKRTTSATPVQTAAPCGRPKAARLPAQKATMAEYKGNTYTK